MKPILPELGDDSKQIVKTLSNHKILSNRPHQHVPIVIITIFTQILKLVKTIHKNCKKVRFTFFMEWLFYR